MNQGALYLDTLIRAIEYFVYRIIRHILDRRLDRKIIIFQATPLSARKSWQFLYLPQRHDGSFVNGKIPVGNHFVHINQIHIPQPLTTGQAPCGELNEKL